MGGSSWSAYTQGDPLDAIPVWSAMAADVITCRPDDTIEEAQRKMSEMRRAA